MSGDCQILSVPFGQPRDLRQVKFLQQDFLDVLKGKSIDGREEQGTKKPAQSDKDLGVHRSCRQEETSKDWIPEVLTQCELSDEAV